MLYALIFSNDSAWLVGRACLDELLAIAWSRQAWIFVLWLNARK